MAMTMTSTNFMVGAPAELKFRVFDYLLTNRPQKPCSRLVYCPRLSASPTGKTVELCCINKTIANDILGYFATTQDIYLCRDKVLVCLGTESDQVLHRLGPLTPDNCTTLETIWLIVDQIPNISSVGQKFASLKQVNLDHNMTSEAAEAASIHVVEHCQRPDLRQIPNDQQSARLVTFSKNRLLGTGYQPWVQYLLPLGNEDLSLLLDKETRLKNVKIQVYLRCPMRICDICAACSPENPHRTLRQNVTIVYDFDTEKVLHKRWVDIR